VEPHIRESGLLADNVSEVVGDRKIVFLRSEILNRVPV
jgi:hypothetical protein